MGIGQITFGGLASGLDTNAIINALLGVESQGLTNLQSRKASEQNKISLFGTLEGLVSSLRAKAADLSSTKGVLGYAVTLGSPDVATFSVTGSPTSGAHTLEVSQLASADRYTFDGVADPDQALSAGSLSFDYNGTSYTFNGGVSLNQLASDINSQAASDVNASVVNTGTSASPNYQLVLAGNDTGAQYTIDNLSVGISELSVNPPDRLSTAANAAVVLDGLSIQRESNVFSDVLPGLSFTVRQTTSAPTSVDVSLDSSATEQNVQGFVDAYNSVIDFLNQQSTYDATTKTSGPLFGDSSLSTIRGALQKALFDVSVGAVQSNPYATLGYVGVQLQADGHLNLDTAKFEEKLQADPNAVESLFQDSTTGVFTKLQSAIDGLVKSTTAPDGTVIQGVFDRRRDTLNSLIKGYDDQITREQRRLEDLQQTLTLQFSNLEGVISNLNAQSAYLTNGLNSIGG